MIDIEPATEKVEENNAEMKSEKENDEEIFYNNDEDIKTEMDMTLGDYEDAPTFMQDNEYIKGGYLLNCNTFKKIFKSIFMWHNETINIWSHLLSAIFFFFTIFFTYIFINNYKSQLQIVRNDLTKVQEQSELLYKEDSTKMDNIYNSIKSIQTDYEKFEKKSVYEDSIKKIFSITSDINNIISKKIYLFVSSFFDSLSSLKDGIISVKEQILDLIKLDNNKEEKLEKNLDEKYNLNLEKRKIKELTRWPLFIIIHCAIICFTFSASFHSIGTLNEKMHDILSRFDYGGISILISGSCYPPYYYFFYYETKFRYFYLILITIFGIGTFLYSLTDDFNKPQRRAVRGIIFLVFGLSTGIPILHMAFFGDKIEGYGPGIKLINWYIGGISYVVGAVLYIIRFPEKYFPRKFDFVGASHQIFHVLVFVGALFHFLGSIDAYNYRFKNLRTNS